MSGLVNWLAGAGRAQQLAGFKVGTSVYGLPVPLVYGQARVAGNMIHMPTLPIPAGSTGSSKTGKGGARDNLYQGPVAIAIAEGPIVGIGSVYRDKNRIEPFTSYVSRGWGINLGTSSQAAWTVPPSGERVPYQFTAYVYHPTADFPNNSLPAYSWEVQGFLRFNPGGSVLDANLKDVLLDYLTDAQHGCGFPTARVGDLTSFYQYSAAAGLFASFVFDSQQPARDHLNELFEIGNTAPVWSDGLLKCIPYGDQNLTANGQTYTANVTPLYDLGDNDFLPRGEQGPVEVVRTAPAQAFNRVTVEYEARAFDYNKTHEHADDQYAQATFGVIPLPTLVLKSIKTAAVAQQVATLRLQREQNVRNTYAFMLGWRFSLLEPMDLVTLTDAQLGLNKTTVRIVSVVELEDERGFDILAEEWPFGIASATAYATASSTGNTPNVNVDPGNTSAPDIIMAPTDLQSAPLEVWIAAKGGTNWGGCDIWISTDNSQFTKVGTIVGACTYGTLTASLASGSRWPATDSTHTLSVDVGTGTLASVSATAFAQIVSSLCYVDGEFVAYRDAALVSAGKYNLTTLYRGLYNSAIPGSHANGSAFLLLDSHVARIPWPTGADTNTIYIKLPAFNIYGGGLQDVSTVSSQAFTIAGNPIPAQNAQPQGTVSIDVSGSWSFSADGGSSAQSYAWKSSTSAFPSDASTISGGTVVSGRTFSVAAGGTLTLGQTIYITIVPFTYPNGNGAQLPSIHIRGSFQDYTATKTLFFGVNSITPKAAGSATSDNMEIVNGYAKPILNTTSFIGYDNLEIPAGVTITSVSVECYTATSLSTVTHAKCELFRLDTTGGTTSLGSIDSNTFGGWETKTFGLSESTTSRRYQLRFECSTNAIGGETDCRLGAYSVTYSMPSTVNAI